MFDVAIEACSPERFAKVVGRDRTDRLIEAGGRARVMLRGRCVVNVNSTATGGGVAEMLRALLGYVRGVGIDVRWAVIEAPPEFFAVTKRIHNHLYGGPGDGGGLGETEHDLYRRVLAGEADALAVRAEAGDLVILHDPQTAGLAEVAKRMGCAVVWRCHVGIDTPNEHSRRGWDFLRPYLEPFVDHYVFTDPSFPPPWVSGRPNSTIWPSIDPFAPKNEDMSEPQVEAILTHVGILAGRPGDRSFTRTDGSPSRVERGCDIFRTGPPAPPEAQMIVQVSRWDTMKDMPGVMEAFARYVDSARSAELVLAGPVVSAVADDPEGGAVLRHCWEEWRRLPHAVRRRVQLVCIPMDDIDENAAIVNALQRHATIVAQKSLAEGFGLTVAEAMLKGTPVVASAVGGITEQVIDGETGFLIEDPRDLESFGAALCRILDDEELQQALGVGARRRAIDAHLGDAHLQRWIDVVAALDG